MPARVGFGAAGLKPLYEKGTVFLDEPQIRMMYVEGDDVRTAWIFADLYNSSMETALYLRKRAAKALGLDVRQVVSQSSENHYAGLPGHLPLISREVLERAGDACEACALEAKDRARAAWMRWRGRLSSSDSTFATGDSTPSGSALKPPEPVTATSPPVDRDSPPLPM